MNAYEKLEAEVWDAVYAAAKGYDKEWASEIADGAQHRVMFLVRSYLGTDPRR